MEKESTFSGFEFDTSDTAGFSDETLNAVREEERKLRRDSLAFKLIGLVTLISAGGALVLSSTGLLTSLVPYLTAVSIGSVTIGGILLLVKLLGKKVLDFPDLKIRRRQMSKNKTKTTEKPFSETSFIRRKLTKSENRVFFGVAGGLAEYAGVSPILMRLIFIVAFFFSAGAITLAYFILAAVLPSKYREA